MIQRKKTSQTPARARETLARAQVLAEELAHRRMLDAEWHGLRRRMRAMGIPILGDLGDLAAPDEPHPDDVEQSDGGKWRW